VTVTTSDGTSAESSADEFTYTSATSPATGSGAAATSAPGAPPPSSGPGSTAPVPPPSVALTSAPPPPVPVGTTFSSPVTKRVISHGALDFRVSSGGTRAALSVPAGALPGGTLVSLFSVLESTGFALDLGEGEHFVSGFAVNWATPSGATPKPLKPLTVRLSGPSVHAGYEVVETTSSGLKKVGKVTAKGRATVTFTSGAAFVVVGVPRVEVLSRTAEATPLGVGLDLSCSKPYACSGSALLSAPAPGRATPALLLASGTFSIGAGQSTTVVLAPTEQGRSALASLRRPEPMVVNLTGAGGLDVTVTVMVRPSALKASATPR